MKCRTRWNGFLTAIIATLVFCFVSDLPVFAAREATASVQTPYSSVRVDYDGLIRSRLADESIFADVSRDDPAYEDMWKLAEISLIDGDAGTSAFDASVNVIPASKPFFRPDSELTREEAASIVALLAKLTANGQADGDVPVMRSDIPDYADVLADSWSYEAIRSTSAYIRGYRAAGGTRYFEPASPILRGDFVAALMKLAGADIERADYSLIDGHTDSERVTRYWRPYAAIAVERSVLHRSDDGTLGLDSPLSRREACTLIVLSLGAVLELPEPKESVEIYLPDLDSGFYDAYFDDAVFVGDSISYGLRNYVLAGRARGENILGDARFLTAISYSLLAAERFNPEHVNLTYQGVETSLENCLAQMGAAKVYIMLGTNDHANARMIDKYERIVDNVYKKNPDIGITIQFCTPVAKSGETAVLTNEYLDAFNAAIVDMCERRGLGWVDVGSPMKDAQNGLKVEYSSDMYTHMNNAGCESWIDSLRKYACYNYLTGDWGPPETAAAPETYEGKFVYVQR